jgi:hypothetical protein
VVEKIWNFDVSRLFLWIFLRLGTLLELFFKNQGSNFQIMDCGLILEKPRGFFAKLSGIIDFGIIFVRKKLWTQSMGHGPRPASVHGGPPMDGGTELTGARCASVPAKGWERKRGVQGPVFCLTEGRAAARRPGDGGEGGGREELCCGVTGGSELGQGGAGEKW